MPIEKIVPPSTIERAPQRQPERIVRPERSKFELPWFRPEKKAEPVPVSQPGEIVPTAAAPVAVPTWQAERAAAIDKILAEGLNEIFLKMKPSQQKAFKEKGEETVSKINLLLGKTKIRVGKIISLIRAWLKMVPGINRFFLEQEAKIKADKIMKLKDKF